jgi:hypothetical protein
MPYKSLKQERFFHTDTAKKAGITPDEVDEFDQASKGMKLPEAIPEEKPATSKPRKKKLVY